LGPDGPGSRLDEQQQITRNSFKHQSKTRRSSLIHTPAFKHQRTEGPSRLPMTQQRKSPSSCFHSKFGVHREEGRSLRVGIMEKVSISFLLRPSTIVNMIVSIPRPSSLWSLEYTSLPRPLLSLSRLERFESSSL
jgi:hypothetical protein